jgi:hypothetical protein
MAAAFGAAVVLPAAAIVGSDGAYAAAKKYKIKKACYEERSVSARPSLQQAEIGVEVATCCSGGSATAGRETVSSDECGGGMR